MSAATTYEPHPLAELLPDMEPTAFAELVEDIRRNGQLMAAVIYEDKVLDGRHRLRACAELGIEPRTEQFAGDNPAGFVLAMNIHRRQLSASQRALIAARFLPALAKEARHRQGDHLRHAERDNEGRAKSASTEANLADQPDRTAVRAGLLVGVSRATVNRTARVMREAPELIGRVESGEMSIRAAEAQVVAALPKVPSPSNGEPLSAHGMTRANAHKRRLIELASTLSGYAAGLDALDVPLARRALTDDEAAHWDKSLSDSLLRLRQLRNDLRSIA